MENILKELQEYQVCALQKGISYDLSTEAENCHVTSIRVSMYFSEVSECVDNHSFQTTFSNDDRLTGTKLGRIKKFIDSI